MAESQATVTEVVIHPAGDFFFKDAALILRLEPEGDHLELSQGDNKILLEAGDLPVLLREGMRLLGQEAAKQIAQSIDSHHAPEEAQ